MLDVALYKYTPAWVGYNLLLAGMRLVDPDSRFGALITDIKGGTSPITAMTRYSQPPGTFIRQVVVSLEVTSGTRVHSCVGVDRVRVGRKTPASRRPNVAVIPTRSRQPLESRPAVTTQPLFRPRVQRRPLSRTSPAFGAAFRGNL